MEIFNNREIASAFWIVVILLFALSKKRTRKSIFAVIKSALHYKIILPIFLFIGYSLLIVLFLSKIGFWQAYLIKDTVIWVVFVGVSLIFRFVTSKNSPNLFKKHIKDNITVVLILEFIINTYTFSLVGEILFLPAFTMIALVNTYTDIKQEHESVKKLSENLLSIIGLIILTLAVIKAFGDFSNFSSTENLRRFLLPVILSFLSLPYLYLLVLVSNYEQLFLKLEFGQNKDKKVKRAAKRVIIKHCLLSLRKTIKAQNMTIYNLVSIRNENDVNNLDKTYKSKL